jgi:anti-sigma B factor antagonist
MSVPEPQQVEITTSQEGDRLTATVAGEIDAASADAFEQRLMPALAESSSVVLDLSGVSFMDSSGLRALMTLHAAITARGGGIELSGTSTAVDRLLSVTGLDDHFTRSA